MARERKDKKSSKPNPDKAKLKKQAKALSAEYVAESDGTSDSSDDNSSSDDAEQSEEPPAHKKLANGIGKTNGAVHQLEGRKGASSDRDDSDSTDSSADSTSDAQLEKSEALSGSAESRSDSGSDSSSDSYSESHSDSMSVDKQVESAAADSATGGSRQQLFATKAYGSDFSPPSGFTKASSKEEKETNPDITTLLSEKGLEGKQVWHITAPSGVPISKLKEISLQAIETGDSVVAHKDERYHFLKSARGVSSHTTLLIPNRTSYEAVDLPVANVLHLQQMMRTDPSDGVFEELDESTSVAQQKYRKPSPPEQPQGLRMRYQPIGVVEKRKPSNPSAPRKRAKHNEKAETELPDRTAKADETPEERAQRKVERRARKDQKRIAKEAEKTPKAKKR